MTAGAAIVTAAQMRAAEQALFDSGIPEYDLMERAGTAAAEIIWRAGGLRDTLVLCGPGNNGGDGYVIARRLRERGVKVRVAVLGPSRTLSGKCACEAWNGPIEPFADAAPATQLVDALFGIGLSRPLDAKVAAKLTALVDAAMHSYAIDVPSGIDSDSGALLNDVPRFDTCISFAALKPGHVLQPAASRMGRAICVDIGVEVPGAINALAPPTLYAPDAQAHKYSRGLVAVVGGGMPGASLLASIAAARSGAGSVRRFADDRPAKPHAIINRRIELSKDIAQALADKRTSVVLIGPGLGLDDAGRERLHVALEAGRPMVLDADALTLLGQEGSPAIPANAILTPHEGEFQRLFGDLPGSKIDRALTAATKSGAIVIYKGADTVIAAPDGRAAVAGDASRWLSTAGTGDVLAGIVAGRFAVTGDPFQAACEAVWLHGDAARRAGAAFIADDLLECLPAAIAARL